MGKSTPAGTTRGRLLKTLLGFTVAVALVGLLVVGVGWERTLSRLRTARPGWVLLACLSSMLCLAAWTKTWQAVLSAAGVSVPYRKLVGTFFAATFANYVTPMGQAGGEPFIAYVLSRDTEATYEQSLASVVTADLIRLLPFFTVGSIGLGYLLFTARVSGVIERFALVLVSLAVALPFAAVVGWRFRERVRNGVLWALGPFARRTSRLSIPSARDRIDSLYGSLEVIATDPPGASRASRSWPVSRSVTPRGRRRRVINGEFRERGVRASAAGIAGSSGRGRRASAADGGVSGGWGRQRRPEASLSGRRSVRSTAPGYRR